MADSVLPDDEVRVRLRDRSDWSLLGGSLHRELTFSDFTEAFAFMTKVADAAERLDHHPDWSNSWNKVVIDISSHAAAGITQGCFALVDAVDEAVG